MSRMYRENVKSLNAFVGCCHGCVYCKPSFQRQMKRQKCQFCKTFVPHYHNERLWKILPKTGEGEFIFFPSCGDLAFATPDVVRDHIEFAKKWSDRTFLVQSKNPEVFLHYKFPDNVILGTTIETNLYPFHTPSKYEYYSGISKAPFPVHRANWMTALNHGRKAVTIEPILQFSLDVMVKWMEEIKPEIIWVGYDNHRCSLPEPKLAETQELIEKLRAKGFDVRVKSLRKAWYEV